MDHNQLGEEKSDSENKPPSKGKPFWTSKGSQRNRSSFYVFLGVWEYLEDEIAQMTRMALFNVFFGY